jgi:hypothetical protein
VSSSGIISGVTAGAPTTTFGEEQRQVASAVGAMPGQGQTTQTSYGTIVEIHPSAPMVKAVDRSGHPIANSKWIPLVHSAMEIRERFGKLRKGLTLMVTHTGVDGDQAIGTITGAEGEVKGEGTQLENSVKKGAFAIFSPGIGIG